MDTTGNQRLLVRVIEAVDSRDGDGVKIQRVAGRQYNVQMDPFLLVDEIRADSAVDYIGGFPPHPHRGFETITYMLDGYLRHRDHLGNEGIVGPGGAQWMTAGRGIIHSEMPEQAAGLMHGFQLWLNLPAADKMRPASWRDVQAQEMATADLDNGVRAILLAGELQLWAGVAEKQGGVIGQRPALYGPIQTVTGAVITDLRLPAGGAVTLQLPSDNSALVYVIAGSAAGLRRRQMGVFGPGDTLCLAADDDGAHLLVLSGIPLREPIAQYGPFVMNHMAEIDQAIADYRSNKLV
jgi:redox-sensitive bicupin YhaK (pirin superfamily)